MTENTQWIYTNDCTPVGGQTIRFKLMDGETSIAKVEEDGTIHLPEDDENTFQLEYYWTEIPKPDYQMPSLWKSVFKNSLLGIVIHCATEEESKNVLNRAHSLGWKWAEGQSYKELSCWSTHTHSTCYNFYNGTFLSLNKAFEEGKLVYSAKWFIDLADSIIKQASNFKNVIVNCKTREEAKQLTTYMHNLGYKWSSGTSYLERGDSFWDNYGESTYCCAELGTYATSTGFPGKYLRMPFKDFKAKCEGIPKGDKLTGEDLKDIVIQCANPSELELCYGYAIDRELFTPGKLTSLNTLNIAYGYFGDQTCIDFTNNRLYNRSNFLKEGYRIRPAKWFLENF